MSEIDDKRAEAHLEQILEAISSTDTDTIQAMFSEQAQSDAIDLPGSIDALFSFIQETIESWEHWSSSASESNDYGVKVAKEKFFYVVTTSADQYMFYLLEYTEDTNNPQNIGLYMLQVVRYDETHLLKEVGSQMACAGVCILQEETD